MLKRLFVGNIPYTTSGPELEELFAKAGNVESVNLIIDRESGRGKGFAFVEMATEGDAKKAIEMFQGYKLGDREIIVNEARPKEERPPGNRGFGTR